MQTHAEYWQAITQRDRRYDGQFFYAVKTTGVFCRPSCPSRRPLPENVEFFTEMSAAEAAGFRPCRRCRPGEIDTQIALVQQVCAYLDARLDAAPTLDALGAALHVSPFHLQRVFKRLMGVSPRQYVAAQRLKQFKTQLKEGESITRAVYEAGYQSSSSVYRGQQLGMKPGHYREGGQGATITYTTAPCSLGYVLVAATEQGICTVSLGDDPALLEAGLIEEYPAAQICEDRARLGEWVQAVIDYVDTGLLAAELPLDIQATAFQQKVWATLRTIPVGTTRSYQEVAQMIGQPTAARAVARACATNRIAVLIPCHRVVREDGQMGGYRWGLTRKETLLTREKAVKNR